MKTNLSFFLFFAFTIAVFGQQKITVEEIYSGAFRAKGMDELQSMKNTNQYTVLNYDKASRSMQIDLFDFATLKKVNTLIDSKNFPVLADGIDSYTFSPDEKFILIANTTNPIFRHSFTADYYLFDTKKGSQVGGTGEQFDWSILQAYTLDIPYFLAGGLDTDSIAEAKKLPGIFALDFNSKLESSPGLKDLTKVNEIMQNI